VRYDRNVINIGAIRGELEGLSPFKNIHSSPKNHAELYIIILINKNNNM